MELGCSSVGRVLWVRMWWCIPVLSALERGGSLPTEWAETNTWNFASKINELIKQTFWYGSWVYEFTDPTLAKIRSFPSAPRCGLHYNQVSLPMQTVSQSASGLLGSSPFSDRCLPTCYLLYSHVITFHTVYINSLAVSGNTQVPNKQANEEAGLFHTLWFLCHMSLLSLHYLPGPSPFSSAFPLIGGLQSSRLSKLHFWILTLASHLFPDVYWHHFLITFRFSFTAFSHLPHCTAGLRFPVMDRWQVCQG